MLKVVKFLDALNKRIQFHQIHAFAGQMAF